MTKKNISEAAERQGKIKVDKLSREEKPVTELTVSDQKQVNGGAPQTTHVGARGPKPGGGCDEFGCGTNHNETLARDTSPRA